MDVKEIIPTGKFTEAQLDLLKMFSHDVPDDTWKEIRHLISGYFAQKATEEMDGFLKEKGWGEHKLNEWGNEHMRTPYKK